MPHDLMETFREVVRWFNRFVPNNWEHLEPLLHDNIKMKRIDELTPNSYHEGKKEVHDYFFVGNGKDDLAVFTLDEELDEPPDHQEIGDYGFVSGAAWFTGITNTKKGATKPRRIAYSFTYKRGDHKDPKNWQEIHSWGKYEDKITTDKSKVAPS
jgi:hypothetical protein